MATEPAETVSQSREDLKFPSFPLVATLATQSLATMAAYSFPVVAPVIAQDLEIPGTLVGFLSPPSMAWEFYRRCCRPALFDALLPSESVNWYSSQR